MDQLIGWLIMGSAVSILLGVLWKKPRTKPRLTLPQHLSRALYWLGARLMAHARAFDEYLMIYRRHREFLLWRPQNEIMGREETLAEEQEKLPATERTYKPLEDTRG